MTYTEEYTPTEEDQELDSGPAYPSAFGITFTPIITGAGIAIVGLLGALYLLLNLVLPAWQKNQELQTKVQDTQDQIKQKQESQKKINAAQENLAKAQQQKKQVLALFANDKTLDTLLLDINRFIASRQGKLQSFVPDAQPATVVSDGSLGEGANGKLKSKTVTVALNGSFDKLQSIVRSIERLQTLLLIKDFKVEVGNEDAQKFAIDGQGKAVVVGQPTLQSSFKLQVLQPLTPEESAAAAPPAAAPAAAAAPPPAKK